MRHYCLIIISTLVFISCGKDPVNKGQIAQNPIEAERAYNCYNDRQCSGQCFEIDSGCQVVCAKLAGTEFSICINRCRDELLRCISNQCHRYCGSNTINKADYDICTSDCQR